MLRTYRKSDRSGFNPLFLQLLRIQLRVCGSGRMNHQRLHIGHIGQQISRLSMKRCASSCPPFASKVKIEPAPPGK